MAATDLSRVYMARAKFLALETRITKLRAQWAEACVSDSEAVRLQQLDLYQEYARVEVVSILVVQELREASREAQAAGLL